MTEEFKIKKYDNLKDAEGNLWLVFYEILKKQGADALNNATNAVAASGKHPPGELYSEYLSAHINVFARNVAYLISKSENHDKLIAAALKGVETALKGNLQVYLSDEAPNDQR